MPEFEAVSKETLGTTVYNRIRQAILNGDFRPGDKVKIREIAGQMAVSGTPVRDALLQLVMERALEMPSPREIRVPHLSGAELAEIRLLRVTLEGMAAEAAATRATAQDIARLEELNDTILTAFAEGDAHLALSHNRAFHSYLYRLSGMEVAAEILDRLAEPGRDVISLSEAQIRAFAGNAIELSTPTGPVLALSETARAALTPDQLSRIEAATGLLPLSIPTLERAGGSVRCMLAGVHLAPRTRSKGQVA